MSCPKRGRLFPIKPRAISSEELAQIVASALRKDFGENPSAVKRIGRLTHANLRAIKNWYQARHAPSSGHLLLLAQSSTSILRFILKEVSGDDSQLLREEGRRIDGPPLLRAKEDIYADKIVSINVAVLPAIARKLNERQLWFMGMLQQNRRITAEDIVRIWSVNERTAWRDVKRLSEMKIIRFIGARKRGHYLLMGGCDIPLHGGDDGRHARTMGGE